MQAQDNSADHFPPTIIVVHPKEKRRKCSVEPLRGRPEFTFWKYPYQEPDSLAGYVRLGIGGPQLSEEDYDCGLLILDGTWRLTEKMEQDYADIPVKSLGPWETAYPRKSKLFEDPAAGLATIEALFAAHYQMGRETTGLLDHYHWGEEFLKINQEVMARR